VTSFDLGNHVYDNSTDGPSDNPNSTLYCSPVLHEFAFDVTWIMLVLDFTFPFCYLFYASQAPGRQSTIERRSLSSSLSFSSSMRL
jgi:hypothetical protein